ncbi:MAG: permease prefix domain 1-containing protein, partial [Gemmatimonadaceae bacterium]
MRRLFSLPSSARRLGDEIDAEIAHHLDARAREFIERGLSPDDARAEALRRFGDVPGARRRLRRLDRERLNRERVTEWLASAWFDLRLAVRALRHQPALSASVIVVLALGLGATTAMFGIVDRLWFRAPDHVRHADRLSRIYVNEVMPMLGEMTQARTSYVYATALGERARSFDGVAAYTGTWQWTMGDGDGGAPINLGQLSWNFFPILGVRPELGRFFTRDEDVPPNGAHAIV